MFKSHELIIFHWSIFCCLLCKLTLFLGIIVIHSSVCYFDNNKQFWDFPSYFTSMTVKRVLHCIIFGVKKSELYLGEPWISSWGFENWFEIHLWLIYVACLSEMQFVMHNMFASQVSVWTGGRWGCWCSRWWQAGHPSTLWGARTTRTRTQKTTSSKVSRTALRFIRGG